MNTTDTIGAVVNPLLFRMVKHAGEPCAPSAGAAPHRLRERLTIKMPRWTITQYLQQNIKLEAIPSVKICVSKSPKESTVRR